jgi:hypothetical protein
VADEASPRDVRPDPAPSGAGSSILFVAILCALGSAPPARAAEPVTSIDVGVAFTHFDYRELSAVGRVIDTERGWVPSLSVRAELAADRFFGVVDGRLGAAAVRYEGRTQSANPSLNALPVTTDSEATFSSAEARMGGWLDEGRRFGLYGGAAARWWERGIRPTTVVTGTGATAPVAGLDERYAWQELQAGLRWIFLDWRGSKAELDARFVQGLRPHIGVSWLGRRVELDLGARPGWRLGLTWRVDLGASWFLALDGEAERFQFGESPVDPVARVMEPESETTNLTLGARAGGRF